MSKNRTDIVHGSPVPQDFFDSLQEFISTMSGNLILSLANPTTLQVVAGTGANQVTIGMGGPWRYRSTTVQQAHPGGVAGTYDVYVVASANSFAPGTPEVDNTDYTFGLAIVTGGGAAPTGTFNGRAIAHTRIVGTLTWSGTAITAVYPKGGAPSPQYANDDVIARLGAATQTLIGSVSGAAGIALGSAGDVTMTRDATGPRIGASHVLSAPGFQVGGVALAASHLSNGVSGSGAVALVTSPTFLGAPIAPTAAQDTNTTQIATTAFVLAQAASGVPNMDGAAAVGTSLRYARQDHVHPIDTSRAPLASPALSGVPTAPTAAVGTNTTQVATTAFVASAQITVPNQQAASYTLVLADANKTVEMASVSALTLTVPTNAAVPFTIGTVINVVQSSTGSLNIAAAGGVTLYGYNNNLRLAGAYAVAALIKRTTDTWWVAGNLVP